MTDRIHSLVVTLAHDLRDDDCEALIAAIQQLRGVLAVHGNISDISQHVAYQRAKLYFEKRLWDALRAAPEP